MEYETVIGLEVHVQLQTQSKMFCSCRADYQSAPPNSLVCPVCLGLPGTLPIVNRKAVEYTIMTGLALGCQIPRHTKFDRKNYPYPDLMKGYQISQYDLPLAVNGCLEVQVDPSPSGEGRKAIGIQRVHLEEDVAKLQHFHAPSGESYSLVDVNRSGVPLMEVVSAPDLRSPEEARIYLTVLHSMLQYLGVSTANMQDGSFRCDANVSLRPRGSTQYGTRTEIKNMNSFRAVHDALSYEVERQQRVLDDGGRVVQETRGWVEERNVTVSQRSKEYAHDYRYFPEPDLPPLVIDPSWVEELHSRLPELAPQRKARLVRQYGIPEYDATLLTSSKAMADYYEAAVGQEVVAGFPPEADATTGVVREKLAKIVSNWILGDLSRLLNLHNQDITETKVAPAYLVEVIELIDSGTLSVTLAKTVLEEAFETGRVPREIVREKGYTQIGDLSVLKSVVAQAIEANPQAVADYLKGKETAARFLVGQVMKITGGKAKPELANRLVQEGLASLKNPPVIPPCKEDSER